MTPLTVVLVSAATIAALSIAVRQFGAYRDERRRESVNLFWRDILNGAGEGISVYDAELRCIFWNRLMEDVTGIPMASVIGRGASEVLPSAAGEPVSGLLARALAGETVVTPDLRHAPPSDHPDRWITSVYRPLLDGEGRILGVIAVVRDITARKAAEQQIEYQAYHDALTGLANRRLFQEHLSLALALAQRRSTGVAVLFLDLDHFKVVNDSLGHSVGDMLLQQIATRLKSTVREGDSVARVGGDEFTIVLHELSRTSDAAVVAEKLLQTVAAPMEINGMRLQITTSIGITVFPDDGTDAETLLKSSDAAMYAAKAGGRNRYQMATSDLSESTIERISLEAGLFGALEQGEFELLYQPQVEVETMLIVGIEALLRWNHPQRGVVVPDAFISVAEERGFIVPIGEWVIREACRAVRRFHLAGYPYFRVAVNLSARQFRDARLLPTIVAAIADANIPADTLELEITESIAMEDAVMTTSALSQLRKAGVLIAIDDFGTGHSSLSYLKRFQIDAVKIDKSFVADLPEKFEDVAIVSSIIHLANGLGLRVVAEGVETADQLAFLRENGCREVQGFFFSYPVRLEEIERLVIGRGAKPMRAEPDGAGPAG